MTQNIYYSLQVLFLVEHRFYQEQQQFVLWKGELVLYLLHTHVGVFLTMVLLL
jgi:hypothetical protein